MIKSNHFISVTSTPKPQNLYLLSHCDLSIRRVCLGTKMADSNRRQWGSNVGENQELLVRIISTYGILVVTLATLYIKHAQKEQENG